MAIDVTGMQKRAKSRGGKRSRGGGKGNRKQRAKKEFVLQEGTNDIRIVPYIMDYFKKDLKDFSYTYWVHWGVIAGEPILCPRNVGKPCPVCELVRELWDSDDANDRELVRKRLKGQKEHLFGIMSRDNPKGIQPMFTGPDIHNQIEELLFTPKWTRKGDFFDFKNGRDLSITKKIDGPSPRDTSYNVIPDAVRNCTKDLPKDWKKEIENLAKALPKLYSYDELQEMLNNRGQNKSEATLPEDMYDTTSVATSNSTNDDDGDDGTEFNKNDKVVYDGDKAIVLEASEDYIKIEMIDTGEQFEFEPDEFNLLELVESDEEEEDYEEDDEEEEEDYEEEDEEEEEEEDEEEDEDDEEEEEDDEEEEEDDEEDDEEDEEDEEDEDDEEDEIPSGMIVCPACEGSGTSSRGKTCRPCKGSGYIPAPEEEPGNNETKCPFAKGDEVIYDGDKGTVQSVNNDGVITVMLYDSGDVFEFEPDEYSELKPAPKLKEKSKKKKNIKKPAKKNPVKASPVKKKQKSNKKKGKKTPKPGGRKPKCFSNYQGRTKKCRECPHKRSCQEKFLEK